ncbi:LOW QUALITY PROTEIN: vascular endothelial growth factor receptor 2-like [Penaeus chinensis]|uniref:LOW QUALITY PROTEIN: vascular endothelial growth factor receptor 2-like n=1 Tax=Penaeus chinensis TaxID=139456 RepID=UPI001FB6B5CA|nr:LOW QUALITY PROTEIN: vascular endothelial growth factor receptor 2-like [Penaeus chinensis]
MKFFLSLGLLFFCQAGWVFGSNPPRLNVTESVVIDTRSESFLSLRCEGTETLNWNWTTGLPADHEILKIEHTMHLSSDYPYVSTFTILQPDIVDTGYYYCFYNSSVNPATDFVNATRTYVYVHDGQTGLIQSNGFEHIAVTTSEKMILDCRTTLPDIEVKLFKNDEEITSEVLWDSRVGFIRRNLVIQDSGSYRCRTEFDVMDYLVEITPGSDTVPKPAIDWAPNQPFVIGYDIFLNCSLIWKDRVVFRWDLPNPLANYSQRRSQLIRSNSTYEVSTLHVKNVSKEDSGEYKCKVTAKGSEPNEEKKLIVIKETQTPYINLSSVPEVKLDEGDTLRWKTEVYAFPANPQILYRNWRGKEVVETDRVTTEHRMNDAESWLRIKNASVIDFGQYTIEVSSSDETERKSKSVFVYIRSKPHVTLYGIPANIDRDEIINASCISRSYPLPEVDWMFQPCPNGPQNCGASFEKVEVRDPVVLEPDPGNIKLVKAPFSFNSSGLLKCIATNEFGNGAAIQAVIISDIDGNFVFRHIGRNVTTELTRRRQQLEITENDDFYLECGAVRFSYKRVSLESPELSVKEKVSNYTLVKYVEANKVAMSSEVTYRCSAEPHATVDQEVREVTFKVFKEQRVTFTKDANVKPEGFDLQIEENEPFTLNCTVTGMPSPVVKWFKDGYPLTQDSKFFDETTFFGNKQQSIEFSYIFEQKHVGTYTCRAENRLGVLEGSLTITVPAPGLSAGTKIGLAFAFIGILILIVVVVVLMRRVKEERKFRKSFRKNELYLFEKGNIGQLNPDCTADEQAELLPYSPEWEIQRDDISLGRQLGTGAFGRVIKATVTGLFDDEPKTTVALKMCKSQSDQSHVQALTRELKVMIHLGKHLNIVNLMGANTINIGKGELWILVEYCRYGNLLSFMHRHRKNFVNQINPVTGKIDSMKTVQEASTPLSPVSQGTRYGYQPTPVTDMDGYLAPTPKKFNLASVPRGHYNPSSPPQSPTSGTDSSDGSSRPEGLPEQYVDNPGYNKGFSRSVSESQHGEMHPAFGVTSSNTSGGSRISDARNSKGSHTPSDQRSVGYYREKHQIVNTDMTLLHSSASPMSPMSNFPLSPTDSNHVSDLGVDSQGNPFTFDTGLIPGITAPFTTSDLVSWSWQVAQGMEYLSRRKVLHGDLAARNLLLADNNVVKISDFGLSRDMYKKDIYMKKGDDLMPIKWMSIEAIRDRIFSVQSDVWAYGVTLWELFTLGSTPYPGVEVNKDFLTFLENGNRMDRPKYANQEIYRLLLECWSVEPLDRPTFSMCADRLGILMLPDLREQYMTMNDPYVLMNEERFQKETDYLNMLSSPDFENLNRKDELQQHYVNVPGVVDGNRESNYLSMKSPDTVGYSRVGLNHSSVSEGQNPSSNSHYLPMSTTRGSDSPMVDVFSPRPAEDSRFSFYPEGSEEPALCNPSDEESKEQETENSSLIGEGSQHGSKDSLRGSDKDKTSIKNLESNSARNSPDDHSVPYINLVSHGCDYVNV